MTFNSLIYPIFLFVVALAHWSLRSQRYRSALLLASGLLFYGWWDYRFLGLLLGIKAIAYAAAISIDRAPQARLRKCVLGIGIAAMLGILFFFKYFNYFESSTGRLMALLGLRPTWTSLNIVLPVGISFYTFQAMSYVIDVYNKAIPARTSLLNFLTFVSFFPQLVAGPIEKAHNLLPQLERERTFDYDFAKQGIRAILLGFWLKCVLADNLSPIVDAIFQSPEKTAGYQMLLGSYLFAFQIYGDFAGYSYIAIGSAALFNIKLTRNFALPYFSESIKEFWTRWHVSLTSWFKEYFYIGMLGCNRKGAARKTLNVLATFCISGLWHGAHVKFLAWGMLHGLLYHLPPLFRSRTFLCRAINVFFTFNLVCLAWVFFRAKGMGRALELLYRIPSSFLNGGLSVPPIDLCLALAASAALVSFEFTQRNNADSSVFSRRKTVRWAIYLFIAGSMLFAGSYHRQPFIYFQF
jgi:alginate O-acetyltransferase complex protein AlgI